MLCLRSHSLFRPYNEANRIGAHPDADRSIDYFHTASPESEIIVVDDGSTDATADGRGMVFAGAARSQTQLIQRSPNQGRARLSGRVAGSSQHVQSGLFSDADLSTPIEETPKLLEPIFAGEAGRRLRFARVGSEADRECARLGIASKAAVSSIFSCGSARDCPTGTHNADSRHSAWMCSGRSSNRLGTTASASMSSCFISRNTLVCACVKSRCAGIIAKAARSIRARQPADAAGGRGAAQRPVA